MPLQPICVLYGKGNSSIGDAFSTKLRIISTQVISTAKFEWLASFL